MNILINDATGDIDIQANNWVMVQGTEEISQIIKQNLQTVLGEWFLDSSLGLPWFTEIFEKGQSQKNIDTIFIDEIGACPGVISLVNYSSQLTDKANRVLSIEFQAYTVEGILDFTSIITPTGGA